MDIRYTKGGIAFAGQHVPSSGHCCQVPFRLEYRVDRWRILRRWLHCYGRGQILYLAEGGQ